MYFNEKVGWNRLILTGFFAAVTLNYRIEGLICLEPRSGFVFVHLVENAPWTIGDRTQEFIGVGRHLFA